MTDLDLDAIEAVAAEGGASWPDDVLALVVELRQRRAALDVGDKREPGWTLHDEMATTERLEAEVRLLREKTAALVKVIRDIDRVAQPHMSEDDFVTFYLMPVGPLHRGLGLIVGEPEGRP